MEPIPWSENIAFPYTCDFCIEGCQCGSTYGLSSEDRSYRGENGVCPYCEDTCNCDAGDIESEDCTCECECCMCSCECEILEIDANSYNQWIKEVCLVCDAECLTEENLKASIHEKRCLKQVGKFQFYVRTFPEYQIITFGSFFGIGGRKVKERATLDIIEGEKGNKVCFTGRVHIPMIAIADSGSIESAEKSKVWMSLTPMEVLSQRPALKLAKGKVLIAGLGMGWLTHRVLELPQVTSVSQVELDPEILNFFGEPLLREFPNKLTLINDDIWKFIERINLEDFDTILFDIWPKSGDSSRDRQFKKIFTKHPNVWGWGFED